MLRFLGWLAVGAGALIVLGVLYLLSTKGEQHQELREAIRKVAMDIDGGGDGYQDGVLIWSETEPYRITIEQLPTLEGRRLGNRFSGGMLADQMSWFGVSVRAAIGQCLSIRTDWVLGDELLDGLWLDVDAARPHTAMSSGLDAWEPVREHILQGLLEGYDLTLHMDNELRDVAILEAGPGWADHLVEKRHRRRTRAWAFPVTEDGLVILENLPAARMLHAVQQEFGLLDLIGIDFADVCKVHLRWEEGDRDSLTRALADQLDLHLRHEEREVEVAVVVGVPKATHDAEG